jgi:glycerol-3-phosphate dehydrogenase
VLLRAAPHIVHPMRFVMPHVPELRPAWMIRLGLFLYDYLARRDTLPDSNSIDLRTEPYHDGLKPGLTKGFVYSDCWVDDARLVIANARAAADLGATLLTHHLRYGAARRHAMASHLASGWRRAERSDQPCAGQCRRPLGKTIYQ